MKSIKLTQINLMYYDIFIGFTIGTLITLLYVSIVIWYYSKEKGN